MIEDACIKKLAFLITSWARKWECSTFSVLLSD